MATKAHQLSSFVLISDAGLILMVIALEQRPGLAASPELHVELDVYAFRTSQNPAAPP